MELSENNETRRNKIIRQSQNTIERRKHYDDPFDRHENTRSIKGEAASYSAPFEFENRDDRRDYNNCHGFDDTTGAIPSNTDSRRERSNINCNQNYNRFEERDQLSRNSYPTDRDIADMDIDELKDLVMALVSEVNKKRVTENRETREDKKVHIARINRKLDEDRKHQNNSIAFVLCLLAYTNVTGPTARIASLILSVIFLGLTLKGFNLGIIINALGNLINNARSSASER